MHLDDCFDQGRGYNIGGVFAGDWLAYTVQETRDGEYTLDFRVASYRGGGTFHVEFVQPPLTVLDGLGIGIGDLVSHEAGHLFGCYHTDQPPLFEGVPNLMDPNGSELLGPDLILGTKDDVAPQFGVVAYSRDEISEGANGTLTTVAYGLSTG